MSDNKVFVDGLIVKRHEKAPDFVVCNLSVKVAELVPFLEQNQSNGWVNVQVKQAKSGKYYAELDTWKPTQGDAAQQGMAEARRAAEPEGAMFDDDIPFSNYEYRGFA